MGFISGQILSLALPTAILCTAAAWSSLPDARPYREVFGNENYYLDLYYEVNPDGYFKQNEPQPKVRFHGRLTTEAGEFPISGEREGRGETARYHFSWQEGKAQGRFVGRLATHARHCEPDLNFELVENGQHANGTLRAGFCSGS